MTRRLLTLPLVLLTVALAAPSAARAQEEAATESAETKSTKLDEVRQAVGQNLKAEALALRDLAKAAKAEVKAGRVELTEDAKGKWERGEALWEAILEQVKAEDFKGAYTQVREARRLMADAMESAFKGDEVSAELKKGVKDYYDAVSPRIEAVKTYKDAHELPEDAAAAYSRGKDIWAEAKQLAKDKKFGKALARMMDGLDEVDQVIRFVYSDAAAK